MGTIPGLQELGTAFMSLGDAITGNTKSARQRWVDYSKESIIGSSCAAIHHKIHKNPAKADEYLKGLGRATGRTLLGGGLLENIPVFHELSTAGRSLGDMIGGGDDETARKRWDTYAENSMVGSSCYAIHEGIHGREKHAKELLKNSGKASVSAVVSGAAIAATVATGGAAAPLGTAASAGIGAATGAASSLVDTGVNHALYGGAKPGDYIGGALFGGASGALSGAKQAKSFKKHEIKVQASKKESQMLSNSKRAVENAREEVGNKTTLLGCIMEDEEQQCGSHGVNSDVRSKLHGPIQDPETGQTVRSGNVRGGPAFPNGTPNLDAAAERLNINASNQPLPNRPLHNCAEAHAYENFKQNFPNGNPSANYAVEMKKNKTVVVRAPCDNCAAMGDTYGRAPFAKYDNVPVDQAIRNHIGKTLSKQKRAVLCTGIVGAVVASSGSRPNKNGDQALSKKDS